MSTIKDVAQMAGVSISTVSIVLNGMGTERKIPQKTQDKIFEAARAVGYRQNTSARAARPAGKNEFAVTLCHPSELHALVLARVVRELERGVLAARRKITLSLLPCAPGKLARTLETRTPGGIIVALPDADDVKAIEENPPAVPLVLCGAASEKFPCVSADTALAGRLAAERLLSSGAERIGIAASKTASSAAETARRAFAETCKTRGAELWHDDSITVEDSAAGGCAAGREFLRRKETPRGIYCDSALIAAGLLFALTDAGVSVPGEVSVTALGLTDPDLSRFTAPPLTVAQLPLPDMTAASLSLLLTLLDGNHRPARELLFEPVLYSRRSC